MLSVSGYRGVEIKQYSSDDLKRTKDELAEYRVVVPGQMVVNTMWLNYAGLGVSRHAGYVSPAYRAYTIVDGINDGFLHHLMRSSLYVDMYTKHMQGIRPNSLQIKSEDFKSLPIIVPPLEEQAAIAAFLDVETVRIDVLIAKQKQLIELLKEKRQAVISQAVTKGLDPDVPMKDSGVEWLGEVPAHWRIVQLRRFLVGIEQGVSPTAADRPPEENECGVLKLNAVKSGHFDESASKTLSSIGEFEPRFQVKVGDLLVTRANTPFLVGDACFVSSVKNRVMLCDLVYRLVPDARLCASFARYLLISDCARFQIALDARGSSMSMAKIAQSHIRGWRFAIPPLAEQRSIVSEIERTFRSIDSAIDRVKETIRLLTERRTALISAAVTGQIDITTYRSTPTDTASAA